jgi:hypothetical protein
MKEITIKAYKFNELEEKIQDQLINKYISYYEYPWAYENKDVLKEFENIFPVKIKSWEYGDRNDINFYITDEGVENLSGVRLYKHITHNYFWDIYNKRYIGHKLRKYHLWKIEETTLTGYHIGYDILKPIFSFLKNPGKDYTFFDLMNDCLWAWVYACRDDYEYCTSRSYIIEELENLDYDYTDKGKII